MKRRFAWNYNNNHPCYIISEGNNCYFYISITHAPYWHKKETIPLDMKDKEGRCLFIVPLVLVGNKNEFSSYNYPLKFSYKDGTKIRDIQKIIRKMYTN